jgi:hypothetical protein
MRDVDLHGDGNVEVDVLASTVPSRFTSPSPSTSTTTSPTTTTSTLFARAALPVARLHRT